MPAYGDLPSGVGATTAGPTAIAPGDSLVLFNNETVAALEASIVAARAESPSGSDQGITFFMEFAAAPTASLEILGTNKPPAAVFALADWAVLYTSANKQQDSYTDTARFAYYCAYLASQSAGGKLTVIAQR
jgi:hypothetical protein